MYKPAKSSGGFGRSSPEYKDRWFRLRGNVLFYWRINSNSGPGSERPSPGTDPMGMLLLEERYFVNHFFLSYFK
jgi:hypothetical protein